MQDKEKRTETKPNTAKKVNPKAKTTKKVIQKAGTIQKINLKSKRINWREILKSKGGIQDLEGYIYCFKFKKTLTAIL